MLSMKLSLYSQICLEPKEGECKATCRVHKGNQASIAECTKHFLLFHIHSSGGLDYKRTLILKKANNWKEQHTYSAGPSGCLCVWTPWEQRVHSARVSVFCQPQAQPRYAVQRLQRLLLLHAIAHTWQHIKSWDVMDSAVKHQSKFQRLTRHSTS